MPDIKISYIYLCRFFSFHIVAMTYRLSGNISLTPASTRSVLTVDSSGDVSQTENSSTVKRAITSGTTATFEPIPPRNQKNSLGMFTPLARSTTIELINAPTTPVPRFNGGVLAPDGYIYGTTGANVGTQSRLIRYPTFGTPPSTYELIPMTGITTQTFGGIVLGPNGKLYIIPLFSSLLMIYDLNTYTFTSINVGAGTNKWLGGVLAPNGKIYCAPFASSSVLIIDTSNDTIDVSSITGVNSTGNAYSGGFLSKEGYVYITPQYEDRFIKINPADNSFSFISIGGIKTIGKYSGGTVGTNGFAYILPQALTTYIKLNTATDTFTTTSISMLAVGAPRFSGSILGRDNKIYCLPGTESNIYTIDLSAADAQATVSTTLGTVANKLSGGTTGLDGYIYMFPGSQSQMLRIQPPRTSAGLELNYIISGYRNKGF
jgi:hypothetical protein